MKYDKEATKLNAINVLSKLAIHKTFVSYTEEMIYLSQRTNECPAIVDTVAKHMLEMSKEDQLLMARTSVLIGEVASMLNDKYGFTEEDEDGTSEEV